MFLMVDRVEQLDERRLLYFFFAAVLVVRILYVLAAPSYAIDAYRDYEVIAENIVAGRGYSASPGFYGHTRVEPTAFFAPVYTYFYAGAKYICKSSPNSYLLIRLIQCFASALSVILIFRVGKLLFNQTTAFLTSLVFLLHPVYSHYAGQCNEATFAVLICLLCVYLSLRLAGRASLKRYALLGLAMGMAILLNPSLSPGLVVLVVYLAYAGRNKPIDTAKGILVVVSLALLIVTPWTVRNYRVFHRFVFVKSCLGLNLWLGNNEFATGTSITERPEDIDSDKTIRDVYPFLSKIKSMNEIQRDEAFKTEALRFMKTHPGRAAVLALKKAFYFWVWDKYKLKVLERQKKMWDRRAFLWRGYAIVNVVLVGLCLVALYLLLRMNALSVHRAVIPLFVVSISLVYIVTLVGHLRFRLPLEPFIQMFAMFTVLSLLRRSEC